MESSDIKTRKDAQTTSDIKTIVIKVWEYLNFILESFRILECKIQISPNYSNH